MAKEILLKRSSVEGKEPAVSGMSYGELFINYASGEGKSFLTTKKADDTIAKFMEKSYNDAHYANKDVVDNIEEKTQENTDAISGLTDEIIKTERVIANTLNTINQSAGFDENGNSTLGKSLTDAIKELQDSNGGSTETLDNLQNQIDGIKDEISDLTDDIDAVDGKINTLEENVDTKISGLTDNITTVENDIKNLQNKDIEISNVISGIQETVTDIQDGIDGLQSELDDAVKDLNDYINTKVSSAYIFKGSVNTFNDLPKEGLTNGDVYNVAENYNNHPAGTNWAWVAPKTNENGDILEEGYWDALAGIVDLSGYATTGTTASLQDQIDEISNDYVKNDDLTTAIDGVNSKFDNYATTATTSELSNKVAENTSAITEINESIEDIINDVDAILKDYITTDKLAGEIEKIDDKFSGFTITGRTEEIAVAVSANTNSITGLTETVNNIGDTVDNIESDYVKHEDLDKAISGVTDEFKNYSKTGRTEEIAAVVSANTEAISNINENINDFQKEIDAIDKKISGNTVAISGLTEEIIKTERVIAHTINTINQSAGFNENGESTLDDGESLTDAIKNLQTKNGEIEGNLSNLQNTVDTILSDYVTTTELNDAVKIVDDKLSGFTPNEKVNEIIILVSANTDSISAINETINTIETNLDNLSEKVEDNITDISGLTEDINDMKLKFDEYTTTARTEEIAVAVSANTDSILAISGVVENIQTVVDDISKNYITENDLDNAIDEIDNKFKLYTTVTRTEEISQVVSANTDSISAISGTVKTIQDNYDNLSEKVEDNITNISDLTDEIIKTERVIANTLNTINQSAGFNENGESTLDSGMTLTDAIKALQAKDIEIEGAVSDVQDKVDEMDSEIQTAISSLTETINAKVSSAYIFKGSVDKFENLPSGLTSENIGHVYNVEEKYNNIPAGTNYAWDGEKWDALAGIVDLSIYTTSAVTNEIQTKIDAIESNLSTNYATSASVVSAITEINENFNNYATTSVTNEIATIASNNSESIQNISGAVETINITIDGIDANVKSLSGSVLVLNDEIIKNERVVAQALNVMNQSAGFDENGESILEGGITLSEAIIEIQTNISGVSATLTNLSGEIDNLDSEITGVKESVSALTQEVIDNEEVTSQAINTIVDTIGFGDDFSNPLGTTIVGAIKDLQDSNGGSPDTINGILEDIDNLDSEVEGVKESVSALTQEVIDNEEVVANALATIKQSTGLDENGYSTLGMSLSDAIEEKANSEWVSENFLSTTGGTINSNEYVPLTIRNKYLTEVWVGFEDSEGTSYIGSTHGVPSIYTGSGSNNTILHSGNYSDYSLPITGGTVNGNVLIGTRLNIGNSSSMLRILTPRADRFSWVSGRLAESSDFSIEYNDGSQYGLYGSMNYYTGEFAWQVGRSDGLALSNNLYLQPLGGNVAIGGTTADEKLHVHGNVKAPTFIGSLQGNADSATLLGGRAVNAQDFNALNFTNNGLYSFDGDYVNGVGLPPYYSWNYSVLNMGLASGRRQQVAIPYDVAKMFVRVNKDDVWSSWNEVAFIDSNVASATKLQTPRSIWGQSFDGTGNISGLLTNVDGIRGSETDGGYIGDRNKGIGATDGGSMIYNYSSSPITFHIAGSERMRILPNGNVAIGGTTADEKLHVHGNVKADTFIGDLQGNADSATHANNADALNGYTVNSFMKECGITMHTDPSIQDTTSTNIEEFFTRLNYYNLFGYHGSFARCSWYYAGNTQYDTGQGVLDMAGTAVLNISQSRDTSPDYKTLLFIDAEGNIWTYASQEPGYSRWRRFLTLEGGTCSGIIYAPDFCTTSDARLKDFVGDVEVDFNKLKTIPKKYYYWKDKASGEDLQIGTSAQDLKEVYPTCVQYDEKLDKYSVNYQKLSVVALAAIDKLHEENEELRSELNKQKEELESQKELIKKQQEQIDKILKSLNQ